MKRCSNPNCNQEYLFGEIKTICPFCGSPLVPAGQRGAQQSAPQRPTGPAVITARELLSVQPEPGEQPPFLRDVQGGLECRGTVVEIERHELFYSGKHKLANTLFRGEPYQFGHQVIEYTIRVEQIDPDNMARQVTDFCLYGSFLGRLHVGDEVTVRARSCGNRRIAKAIYNHTTESEVKPGMQLPAWAVRVLLTAVLLLVLWLAVSVLWLFQAAGLPALLVLVLLFFLLRKVTGRRFRRR